MKKLVLLALVISLSGCASQKWYYNQNVKPNEQQLFYDQDFNYCQGVAAGTVPIPNINLSQNKGYRTYGTATFYDRSSARYVDMNYQSQTVPTGSFSSGFSDGWQMGEAISAASKRAKFAKSCMFRLGWREIPCKTCTPQQPSKPQVTVQQLFERYTNQAENKAFAKSTNNVSGASWGAKTEEEAKILAIRTCAESGGKNCQVINVNGVAQ